MLECKKVKHVVILLLKYFLKKIFFYYVKMSLSKLIEDKYKRYLNARVNNLTIDGNLNLSPQSLPISSLQSTAQVGFLHDNSTEINRKNIEISDLQNIGNTALNNTFLRHNAGNISFETLPNNSLNAFADYEIDQTFMPYNMPNIGVNNLSVLRSTISNNFSLISNSSIRPNLPGIYKLNVFISGDLSMATSFRFTMKNSSLTFAQSLISNGTTSTQKTNLSMTKIINLSGIDPNNDINMEIERTEGVGTFVLQNADSFSINLIKIG